MIAATGHMHDWMPNVETIPKPDSLAERVGDIRGLASGRR